MSQNKLTTIVIDPGHGGSDPGAVGNFSQEKNVVMDISKKYGELIKKNFPEVKVLYTRTSDKYVDLYQRPVYANQNNADFFISIHANSIKKNCNAYGFETFVMGLDKSQKNLALVKAENSVILKEKNYQENYQGFNPNDPATEIIFSLYQNVYIEQSLKLSEYIQNRAVKDLGRYDRKVQQAPFWVLWACAMPSVLVELGFICNNDEEMYLNSEIGQDNLARALYNAFVDYKSYFDEQDYSSKKIEYREEILSEIYKDSSLVEKPTTPKQEVIQNNTTKPNENTTKPTDNTTKPTDNTTKPAEDVVKSAENSNLPFEIPYQKDFPANVFVYKVQIYSSSTRLPLDSPKLKGYKNVEEYIYQGVYKYTLGADTDLNKMNTLCNNLKKDFATCWVVRFKNGQRF